MVDDKNINMRPSLDEVYEERIESIRDKVSKSSSPTDVVNKDYDSEDFVKLEDIMNELDDDTSFIEVGQRREFSGKVIIEENDGDVYISVKKETLSDKARLRQQLVSKCSGMSGLIDEFEMCIKQEVRAKFMSRLERLKE